LLKLLLMGTHRTTLTAMTRFLSFLLLVSLSAPALGQASDPALEAALTETAGALHFQALDHTLTFPLPRWSNAQSELSSLQRFASGSDAEALIELLPEGQTFESWGQLHWARLIADPRITLEQMRNFTISGFSDICQAEQTQYFIAREDAADSFAPLVFVCGAHTTGLGLDGLGEIMIAAYRRSDAAIAVVTTEWRGPAFPVEMVSAWPLSPQGLMARANALDAGTALDPEE
jgi:hypothetical protein